MGKASSSKKIARAAKVAGKPGAGRQWGWPLAVGALVVVGVLLIVVSRGENEDSQPPLIGDHWHVAYGVYGCDAFQGSFGESMSVQPSLHSHGDSLIHVEPISTEFTGENATLAGFLDGVDASLSDSAYEAGGTSFVEGESECAGEPGTLQVVTWDNAADAEGTTITEDLDAVRLTDGQLLTIAFVPDGAEVPKPPDEAIAELGQQGAPTSGTPSSVPTPPPSTTDGGASDSTLPGDGSATTVAGDASSTTAPAGTTDTSAPAGTTTAPPTTAAP